VIWLLYALNLYLGITAAYLAFILVGAWLYRREEGSSEKRIAVVIPAHDEESGLATTIERIRASDYDSDLYEIFVIADNCTDATSSVASELGAIAVERSDVQNRGKGQALDWFLNHHAQLLEPFDTVLFVDADMLIDDRFLAEISSAISTEGVHAVQGCYVVANPEESFRTAATFTSFSVVNHVRPMGRAFWGGTAGLKGGGMAFSKELLLEMGWPAHSIAEDAELTCTLLLEGHRVAYCPTAVVTSSMATTAEQSKVQQERWEAGRWQVLTEYLPQFLRAGFASPKWYYMDAILDLLVAPTSMFVALVCASAALAAWVAPGLLWLSAVFFSVPVALHLSGLIMLRAPFGVWLRLSALPIYMGWKVLLLLSLLRKRPIGWNRTPRDHEIA
jgi:cellulose synthase/poly-beta-1,6-N-acetylglucosamine synthase-like glycosyltransferase